MAERPTETSSIENWKSYVEQLEARTSELEAERDRFREGHKNLWADYEALERRAEAAEARIERLQTDLSNANAQVRLLHERSGPRKLAEAEARIEELTKERDAYADESRGQSARIERLVKGAKRLEEIADEHHDATVAARKESHANLCDKQAAEARADTANKAGRELYEMLARIHRESESNYSDFSGRGVPGRDLLDTPVGPVIEGEVDRLQAIDLLRGPVHGTLQTIRGRCSDEADHQEIERLVTEADDSLYDAINLLSSGPLSPSPVSKTPPQGLAGPK